LTHDWQDFPVESGLGEMGLNIVNSLDTKVWKDFVDQHPQGNIFHTPEMFQVYHRAKGYRPKLWAAVNDSGRVLALMVPVQVSIMGGPFRRLTTRDIAYGSILCAPDQEARTALDHLLHTYTQQAKREAIFSELRNLSDLSDIQPGLNQSGFAYEDHLNYLNNIDCSPEDLLFSIGSRTRKHIRQALRKGSLTVEQVADRRSIRDWYSLIQKTYKAARVPLSEISLFEAAFDVLYPLGMIKFWLAKVGDISVAASVELIYKDIIYGWYGGIDRSYSDYLPGELLMWQILKWGAEAGYKVYDFGGAGKPGEVYGVRDFKAKFGGQLVCFGRNVNVHSPKLLRWSQLGYKVYRHFVGLF
jgi:serine/alanine adding enzyme